ncbi:hypothetical protein ABOONEI_270 [Aciduliprofundum boonei T469]|nr:hypothetical protein ABOONEI_270 [Aciduliprofundum boonei T469]
MIIYEFNLPMSIFLKNSVLLFEEKCFSFSLSRFLRERLSAGGGFGMLFGDFPMCFIVSALESRI